MFIVIVSSQAMELFLENQRGYLIENCVNSPMECIGRFDNHTCWFDNPSYSTIYKCEDRVDNIYIVGIRSYSSNW